MDLLIKNRSSEITTLNIENARGIGEKRALRRPLAGPPGSRCGGPGQASDDRFRAVLRGESAGNLALGGSAREGWPGPLAAHRLDVVNFYYEKT